MREYKFRGKRKDNGEWVYGNLVTYFNKPAIQDYAQTNGEIFLVDPETVGQYTGLKDRNGKEIYSHDLFFDEHNEEYGITHFNEGSYWINWETHCVLLGEVYNDYEVIGNRWDNPDLLEG